jgi:hypothetical protein
MKDFPMDINHRLNYLIQYLIDEDTRYKGQAIPQNQTEKFKLFRSLVNVRPPKTASEEILLIQDVLL